jgi:hypothetical protein
MPSSVFSVLAQHYPPEHLRCWIWTRHEPGLHPSHEPLSSLSRRRVLHHPHQQRKSSVIYHLGLFLAMETNTIHLLPRVIYTWHTPDIFYTIYRVTFTIGHVLYTMIPKNV